MHVDSQCDEFEAACLTAALLPYCEEFSTDNECVDFVDTACRLYLAIRARFDELNQL